MYSLVRILKVSDSMIVFEKSIPVSDEGSSRKSVLDGVSHEAKRKDIRPKTANALNISVNFLLSGKFTA